MGFLKANFIFFLYRVANCFLGFLTFLFWPRRMSKKLGKICVYRIGNIGDIVCAIPALIAIRETFPDSEITLLTSPGKKGMPGAKELIDRAWFIDRLRVYYQQDLKENLTGLIKELRREGYDLWIILPAELWTFRTLLKNMIFAKVCGAKKACGFFLSTIRLWARYQSKYRCFDNETERLLKLLKHCKVFAAKEIKYELPLTAETKESALKIMQESGIGGDFLFGFVPGAKRKTNEWPLNSFVQLGKYIFKKYPESKIIIFGGKEDYEKGRYISEKLGKRAINLCGKTTLLEADYIMRHLKCLISVNTGLMHMASLAGIKTIAIFSSAEMRGKWFPFEENSVVLMKEINCQGCYYKNCPKNFACIKQIKPEDVYEYC